MKEIMIVDDEISTIRLIELMFESDPAIRVISAKSGKDCVEKLKAGARPGLILLDIKMTGMDGYETAAHIKSDPDTQDLKIIFFSAMPKETILIKEAEVSADGYIDKYGDIQEIEKRIRQEAGA